MRFFAAQLLSCRPQIELVFKSRTFFGKIKKTILTFSFLQSLADGKKRLKDGKQYKMSNKSLRCQRSKVGFFVNIYIFLTN